MAKTGAGCPQLIFAALVGIPAIGGGDQTRHRDQCLWLTSPFRLALAEQVALGRRCASWTGTNLELASEPS